MGNPESGSGNFDDVLPACQFLRKVVQPEGAAEGGTSGGFCADIPPAGDCDFRRWFHGWLVGVIGRMKD